MNNDTISILEFKKNCKTLNLDLKKDNETLFKTLLLLEYSSELRRGFVVKKQYKTTKKGTLFLFGPIKSHEEAEQYVEKLKEMVKEIGEKNLLLIIKDRLEKLNNEIDEEMEKVSDE